MVCCFQVAEGLTHTGDNLMKVAQIVTDKIIAMLEQGVAPWAKPWAAGLRPMRYIGQPYRGINSLMLQAVPFANPIWLSYKMAQQNGGTVKAGEKGSQVVYYKFPTPEQQEAGKRPYMLYSTVFNLEQTEGVAVPEWYTAPADGVVFDPIAAAVGVIDNMPNAPKIAHGGNSAHYSPTSDTVQLPTPESFASAQLYYSVAFHELAHSTGHASRLDRDLKGGRGSGAYGREELIAELTAAFLCADTGIDNDGVEKNTASYLRGWIDALSGDVNLITQAASAAQRAADYINGEAPEAESEEATDSALVAA